MIDNKFIQIRDFGFRRESRSPDNRFPSPVPSSSRDKQPPPQGEIVALEDILEPPGRYLRPPKIVIIFRGLPGAGKTHFARNIKNKEGDLGADAPRILDLDAYFETDGKVSVVGRPS